ncbi:MAG: phosphatidate cytidylyltransferase [Bacteroidota bacterium]|nr:phosphatidate cytidylyltransferase [Bacteroidota bacterium]
MKNLKIQTLSILLLVCVFASSCSAIEGIFKAGMGVGIFVVLAVFVIIGYFVMKARGSK